MWTTAVNSTVSCKACAGSHCRSPEGVTRGRLTKADHLAICIRVSALLRVAADIGAVLLSALHAPPNVLLCSDIARRFQTLGGMTSTPTLYYFARVPPYAVVAAASIAEVQLTPSADPAATKDYIPKLKLPSSCVPCDPLVHRLKVIQPLPVVVLFWHDRLCCS